LCTEPVRPRYVADLTLPAYAYVPGGGRARPPEPPPAAPLDPLQWRSNRAYLAGFDLFNGGFYWEAHERWEGVWRASGQDGAVDQLLRGLIKLAASGVKVRQGMPGGVRKHGVRAAAHFLAVRRITRGPACAGVGLDAAARLASRIARHASRWPSGGDAAVAVVFDRPLRLDSG
jgi:hypothetical protein